MAMFVTGLDVCSSDLVNAFGQCSIDRSTEKQLILGFTLNFNADPFCSVILEATSVIKPLNELTFNKCPLGGETFQCSAPLYYGGVIRRTMSQNAPKEAYDKGHLKESRLGPKGTFHGPRLSVYSTDYSGVPVKNVSSFCNTRTVYHQDKIFLRVNRADHGHLLELEEDWEWKDAVGVFNNVHGVDTFSVVMLKRDYATTMMAVKGELITKRPRRSTKLMAMIKALRDSDGRAALAMRKGIETQDRRTQPFTTSSQQPKRNATQHYSGDELVAKRRKVARVEDTEN